MAVADFSLRCRCVFTRLERIRPDWHREASGEDWQCIASHGHSLEESQCAYRGTLSRRAKRGDLSRDAGEVYWAGRRFWSGWVLADVVGGILKGCYPGFQLFGHGEQLASRLLINQRGS